MLKHSQRAKKNMRDQINAQIMFLEGNLTGKKKELERAIRFKKFGLPHFDREIQKIKAGITKVQNDIKVAKARKAKLAKEGKI